MKLAFCLSGGPRFKHRGLFNLIDALQGYDEADFFIRTWKSDEFGITAQQFEHYLRSNGLPDKCQFKITRVLDDNAENAPPTDIEPLNVAPWAPNFLVMWWGIVQSYALCAEYMHQTNTKYDLIFRMRTDMVPDGQIDLTQFCDPTKIYNARNFGDNFLYGSPEMYVKFVDYFKYLDVLRGREEFIHPENSLEQYFIDQNIPYECLPVGVFPTWDPGEYKGRPR